MFYPVKQISVDGIYGLIEDKKKPDFHFEGESHPFWELVYVKEGRAGVSADERIYSLSAGDIIFHKPMEFHRIWSEQETSPMLCILTFEMSGERQKELENLTLKLNDANKILLERCINLGQKAFVFNKGKVVIDVADKRLSQEYCNLLEVFLITLLLIEEQEKLAIESSSDSRLFSEIVLFLRDSIDEKLTIQAVSDRFFVSHSRIKKLFSKYSGLGVIGYFNNMKVLEAQKMLRAGRSISQTAERLGFSNQFYFSSVFKKISGLAPSEFKRKEDEKIKHLQKKLDKQITISYNVNWNKLEI